MIRAWLRKWLGIDAEHQEASDFADYVGKQVKRIEDLELEVARLKVAQYVPPQPEEPKPKVIQTRTMREYNAILEREFEHEEA